MSFLKAMVNFYLAGVQRLINGVTSIRSTAPQGHKSLFSVYLFVLTAVAATAFLPYTLWMAVTRKLTAKH